MGIGRSLALGKPWSGPSLPPAVEQPLVVVLIPHRRPSELEPVTLGGRLFRYEAARVSSRNTAAMNRARES